MHYASVWVNIVPLTIKRSRDPHGLKFLYIRSKVICGSAVQLELELPKEWDGIAPGQYMKLYPNEFSREHDRPLYLAVASGKHERLIKVSFEYCTRGYGGRHDLQSKEAGDVILCSSFQGCGLEFDESKPLLIIAGGSTLSVARSVMISYPNSYLLYSTRKTTIMPFFSEVSAWHQYQEASIHITGERQAEFDGARISIEDIAALLTAESQVFIAGSNAFMEAMIKNVILASAKAIADENIFVCLNRGDVGPVVSLSAVREAGYLHFEEVDVSMDCAEYFAPHAHN